MVLPPRAIQFTISTVNGSDLCAQAKSFINLQVRYARVFCDIIFLQACLLSNETPCFISNMTNLHDNLYTNKVVARKLISLEKEILRACLTEYRAKLGFLEQQRGYKYLNLTRQGTPTFLQELFTILQSDIRGEETRKFDQHGSKWSKISSGHYPMCRSDYICDLRPSFPFKYEDVYLCRNVDPHHSGKPGSPRDALSDKDFSNTTDLLLPDELVSLLKKGPNFRRPPNLNTKFLDNVQLSLDRLTYNLRWRNKFDNENFENANDTVQGRERGSSHRSFSIPFQRNSVKLPPCMNSEQEVNLLLFKDEVVKVVKQEVCKTKRMPVYRQMSHDFKTSTAFLKNNDLTVVATDKTNRLSVLRVPDLNEKIEAILNDDSTYKILESSKKVSLEKQGNKLIDSVYKNILNKYDLQRLHSSGTQPARFYALIKDHKDKKDGFYPLRPIASVHNTPTNKIDWLCGQILNQLVQFVPAHLSSSLDLIDNFNNMANFPFDNEYAFISLDVVNLYPSIPIPTALKVVSEFASVHWSKVDSLGISVDHFLKLLTFVSFNYEIQFNKKVFLQKKGCPMGSHYAPPFAIIFMHYIEEKALSLLMSEFKYLNDRGVLYKRFIDDSIFGPFKKDQKFYDRILEVFNSIDDNINFTLESPPDGCLNFLDISVWIKNHKITHKLFKKEFSSGLSLSKRSWLPSFVKTNFIQQSFERIQARSSSSLSEDDFRKSIISCNRLLNKNGFGTTDIRRALAIKKKTAKKVIPVKRCVLKLPFVNDSLIRRVNNLIKKYNMNVSLVNVGNKQLRHSFKPKFTNSKHVNCTVCAHLPNNFNCEKTGVVYQFKCKICLALYIGKTSRPFHFRYKEHKNSINKKNSVSALSDHAKICHCTSIEDFKIDFLRCTSDPVEATLIESRFIDLLKPSMNRRHEGAGLTRIEV